MSNTFFGISVDCTDADALAHFWGAVLGRQVADGATAENAVLLANDESGSGPRLAFHRVPEAKVVKNRLHPDLTSDSFDAETERLGGQEAPRRPRRQGPLDETLPTSKATRSTS